jgi:hypothetical protein
MKKFLQRKLIITCILISTNSFHLFSQTTPVSFTTIPYSDPDIIAPGRGAEQWHNSTDRVSNPSLANPQATENSLDVYYRMQWTFFERVTQNNFVWDDFDELFEDAINHGQKLSFGVMPVFESAIDGYETYDGAISAYPEYLHDLMQAEVINSRDWISNGSWIPNWNSTNYLGRLRALYDTIYGHIMSTSFTATAGPHNGQSIAYKDVVYYIDIRGYGQYGEWHSGSITDFTTYPTTGYPTGRDPSVATLKTIIDHHTEVFDRWPLVMMIAAFNGGSSSINLFDQHAELGYYALTASNDWGPVGWRRDQVGATDSYLETLLENNAVTYETSPDNYSEPFGEIFLDMWKYAPGTGEPMPGTAAANNLSNVVDKIALYHHTSFGNGNYVPTPANNSTAADNARAGFKKAGYRIILDSGSISSSITRGTSFNVNLNWRNIGVAPTYEEWDVVFELKNSSDVTVWSQTSSFTPTLFLPPVPPSTATTPVTDNLTIPTTVPNGNYTLNLIIKDPSGYRAPLPLAISGRNTDGSYTLRLISFTAGNCTSPTVVIANTASCNGEAFNLTLASATGASPYDLTINGVTYNDKSVGNAITSFTPPAQSIWTTTPSVTNDIDAPVELGVKFTANESGYIKGIRFFSSDDVGGTYTGHLWTSSGTLLGSVTFTGVTPLAWQQALFSTPVAIAANTTYIASYHTTAGYYASTEPGLSTAVTNGSLTALASGSSGGNGVYLYGSSPGFPIYTHNSSNYWADVLFVPDTYTFNLTSITDNNACVNTGSPLQSLVVESDVCTGGRSAGQPSIVKASTNSPKKEWGYSLQQSYPNPTRDQAKIVYTLPVRTAVNLSVYDMQGRLIKILVNGVKESGQHSVNVDMRSFAGSMYYYKLQAKDFSATRKLLKQ